MNRVAVFIDAGYLYAASIKAVTGIKQSRSAITLAYEDFLPFIIERAQQLSGRELLRVYWYDGTSTGPTGAHRKLAYQANVKLRLGLVSLSGEQRGVDSIASRGPPLGATATHRGSAARIVAHAASDPVARAARRRRLRGRGRAGQW